MENDQTKSAKQKYLENHGYTQKESNIFSAGMITVSIMVLPTMFIMAILSGSSYLYVAPIFAVVWTFIIYYTFFGKGLLLKIIEKCIKNNIG